MKFLLLFAAVVGMAVAQQFYYATENDHIDIDAVVADLPTLQSYVDCFLEKGPCTSFTESYRKNIQDSVTRACDRCNLTQKKGYAKLLKGLQEKLPHEYVAFRLKYDPRGVYFGALEAELSKYLDYSTEILLPYYYLK